MSPINAFGIQHIVIVVAHPDDAEIGVFGLCCRLVSEARCRVSLIIATRGTNGTSVEETAIARGETLEVMRQRELAQAWAPIGAELRYLDLPDGSLAYDLPTISSLERALKELKPDLVITHDQIDRLDHQDHHTLSRSVSNITKRLTGLRALLFFEPIVAVQVGWAGNLHVDITPYMEAKIKALNAHKSQQGRHYLNADWIRHRARTAALAAGADYFREGHYFESFRIAHAVWPATRLVNRPEFVGGSDSQTGWSPYEQDDDEILP
jgi:LmbE family N-acetylglucosaminyl deacetylase